MVFDRLAATARDAAAIAGATGDAAAVAVAEGWIETLREHGAIVGWTEGWAEHMGSEGEDEGGGVAPTSECQQQNPSLERKHTPSPTQTRSRGG